MLRYTCVKVASFSLSSMRIKRALFELAEDLNFQNFFFPPKESQCLIFSEFIVRRKKKEFASVLHELCKRKLLDTNVLPFALEAMA